jgi:hypothetical protein
LPLSSLTLPIAAGVCYAGNGGLAAGFAEHQRINASAPGSPR